MNFNGTAFPAPQPAPARGLGAALDDFEAGVARSVADGSWLARLLMQLLVMLRDALARFAACVPADAGVADVVAVAPVGALDDVQPMMRARGVRGAAIRQAVQRVVAGAGVASAAARAAAVIWVSAHDKFSLDWVGSARVIFSKSAYWCRKFCVLFVTISKQLSMYAVLLVLFFQEKNCFRAESRLAARPDNWRRACAVLECWLH